MKLSMKLKSALVQVALVACATAAASSYAQAAAGSTGECKDGTYTTAAARRGSCAGHGGVKSWYGEKGAAATAKTDAAAPKT